MNPAAGGRLSTFPAGEHQRPLAGTKLYCLVTEVRMDMKTLFAGTFQDLQRPYSMVFQDSKCIFNACKLPQWGSACSPGQLEIWCYLRPQESLHKCKIKHYPYCKHAVHLIMCKSYQRLDGDSARGGAGSKLSRTLTVCNNLYI